MRLGLITAAVILIFDQLSKWAILDIFRPDVSAGLFPSGWAIEVTPFFNLVLTWNRGVSFGMFNDHDGGGAWILTAVAALIVAGLLIWLKRADGRYLPFALGLVIGGAIGNVIDRIRFGAVVDFLDFHAFGYHWYTFNIADAAIVAGAAMLLLESLFKRQDSHTKDA